MPRPPSFVLVLFHFLFVWALSAVCWAWSERSAGPAPALWLQAGCAVLAALSWLLGQSLGRGFGSVALFALGVGLPLAGLGALTEAIQQRAAANAVGLLGVIAVGAGLLATALRPGASFERWLRVGLGGLLFGHGSRLWLQASGGGWMQPTAYGVAALILMFWEYRRCPTGAQPKKT